MFYEEFVLFADEDDPRAEYDTDNLKIWYYMENMVEGIDDITTTITHEWLHGLFDWATEGAIRDQDKVDADGEHYIMRCIRYES